MAQPTGGDVHINVPLGNISVAYQNAAEEFIATTVFPAVPVDHKSNLYWKYKKGDWFRTVAEERAPATESVGTGWNMEQDQYLARVFAVHKDIADQDRANQDTPAINLDRDATQFVTRDLMLKREKDWAARYFVPTPWTTTAQTGAATAAANQFIQWNRANSIPIEDIAAQRIIMAELTGHTPNVLVIGARVFLAWKNHSEFLERIKYSQKGVVTLDLIAGLMDIDKVVVPYLIENTAAEGATDSFSFVYGKGALLAYANPNPGLLQVSAGYTFSWTGYLGASALGSRVKKFRMEPIAAERVEGEMAYDMKVVSPDLGIFFNTAVQ